MTDVAAAAPVTPAKAPKKKAAGGSKAKKHSDHPKYSSMIKDALNALKERGGSSRHALLKYIMKHYHLGHDERTVNAHLKMALRAGVKHGSLKQSKGVGASGSFKLGEVKVKKPKVKKPKKPKKAKKPKAAGSPKKKAVKAKKPKAAGEKKPKAAGEKKPKAKKPKSPAKAKAAKPKSPKKPKAAKPKKPKTPKAKKPKAAKPKKAAAKK